MSTIVRLPSYDRAVRRGTEDAPEILPAEHGHFSTPFYVRCKNALNLIAPTIEHVVSLNTASGGPSEDNVQASRDAPLPFNEQAWDDANELYKLVVYWSSAFAIALKRQPPEPAARAWRNDRRQVVGLPAHVDPADARRAAGIIAAWLGTHLDDILGTDPEDVTLFGDNLRDVYRIAARWPQEEKPTWTDLPCPRDRGWLAVFPPSVEGAERRYECQTCGHIMTDREYAAAVEDIARSAKVAKQLMRKYLRQPAG